jgi:hypothetical protein
LKNKRRIHPLFNSILAKIKFYGNIILIHVKKGGVFLLKKINVYLKSKNDIQNGSKQIKTNAKQRIVIIAVSVSVFVLSTINFLPVDAILRHNLREVGEKNNLFIQFEEFDVGIFGDTEILNLKYQSQGGLSMQVQKISTDASLLDLISMEFVGNFVMKNISIDYEPQPFRIKSVTMDLDLKITENKKNNLLDGNIMVDVKQLILPPMNIPIMEKMGFILETKSIVVQNIMLDTKANKNTFNIKKLSVKSDIMTQADVTGNITLDPKRINNSKMNLKLCLKPTEKFYSDYTLADTFVKPNEKNLCKITLSGNLKSPKSNIKELLMGDEIPGGFSIESDSEEEKKYQEKKDSMKNSDLQKKKKSDTKNNKMKNKPKENNGKKQKGFKFKK